MNLTKVCRASAVEVSVSVRRRSFWLSALIVPLFFWLIYGARSQAFQTFLSIVVRSGAHSLEASPPFGIVDETGVFARPGELCRPFIDRFWNRTWRAVRQRQWPSVESAPAVRCFQETQSALEAMKANTVSRVIVIPSDFLQSGTYRVYERADAVRLTKKERALDYPFDSERDGITGEHHEALVRASPLSQEWRDRLFKTPDLAYLTVDEAGEIKPYVPPEETPQTDQEILDFLSRAAMIVPSIFVLVALAAGKQAMLVDRSSHMLEMTLTSITAKEYIVSKLLSAMIVNGLQIGIMFSGSFLSFAAICGPLVWSLAAGAVGRIAVFMSAPSMLLVGLCLSANLVAAAALGATVGTVLPVEAGKQVGVQGKLFSLLFLAIGYCCPFLPLSMLKIAVFVPLISAAPALYWTLVEGPNYWLLFGSAFLAMVSARVFLDVSAKVLRLSAGLDRLPFRSLWSPRRRKAPDPSVLAGRV